MNPFEIGIYRDQDTGRNRWAVLDKTSGAWYFPKAYGKMAAIALARRLNSESP